jgi:hypothetical protein
MSDAATHAASTAMAQAPTTEGAFNVSELINHHITDGNSRCRGSTSGESIFRSRATSS